jgi:hypothetical protein
VEGLLDDLEVAIKEVKGMDVDKQGDMVALYGESLLSGGGMLKLNME